MALSQKGDPQECGIIEKVWSPAAQQIVKSGTEPETKPIKKIVMGNQAKHALWTGKQNPRCLTSGIITSTLVLGGQGFGRALIPRVKQARTKSTFNYPITWEKQVIYQSRNSN